ncbi:HAD family hydrolase [Marinobacter sp. HL-58]|uniref:HAD family hydrolase n=1 Tax=Marinobacter sp. HL-58 TaxID=1479237 RepID=UPI00056A2DD3|nr:HAD family hydrolase [Marinobacter sp. HL-58]KPQ01932.1 MAG: putative phosphatase [Marinobacter sp. HL-58]
MLISKYRTWVFDCDGVILDSNRVKTDAFFSAAKGYGDLAASALVKYHVQHGGISRYAKFEYFLRHIIGRNEIDSDELERLLRAYAENVIQGLLDCDIAEGLFELKRRTEDSRWLVVSGGDQAELRKVFEARDLSSLFDGGIFGSPANKDQILKRELQSGRLAQPAVFLGDSRYDYEAANRAGLDFIYLSDWSESTFSFDGATRHAGAIRDLVDGCSAV